MKHTIPSQISVVLSSGYFGFFAHAGFLKALETSGIKISSISGSSSGALTAGLTMSGHSADEIFRIYKSLKKKTFWKVDYQGILKNLFLCKGFEGLLNIEAGLRFFKPYFVKDFSDSKIPGIIIGLNLTRKEKAVFDKGELLKAVLISSTIPFLFKPVFLNGDAHIDGGLVDKAPLWELHQKLPSEMYFVHLLASSILTQKNVKIKNPFKLNGLMQAIMRKEDYLLQKQMVLREKATIIEYNPPNISVSPNSLDKGPVAFERTYQSTMKQIEKLFNQL
jgi:NTE family protein